MKIWLWFVLMSLQCHATEMDDLYKQLCGMERDAFGMVREYEDNFERPEIYYYYVGRLLCIYDVKTMVETYIQASEWDSIIVK